MKRVLFLMPNWKAYSEPWMISMMEALGEHLVAICVLTETDQKHWKHIPIFSINSIRFSFLNHIKARILGKRFYTDNGILSSILKQQKIDTVLGHYGNFVSGFEDTWRKSSVRLLVHMHGFDAHAQLKDQSTGKNVHDIGYVDRLKRISQHATIVANSHYTQLLLERDFGIAQDRIVVKYLGVPHQEFAKQHTKQSQVNIVYVGRLVDFKAPHYTIQAFELACEMGLKGTLTLIGEGYMRQRCQQAIENSKYKDHIHLLGAMSNEKALAYVKEADIFTQHNVIGEFSGQTECLGISILEAMNLGIPVVVTHSGGVAETVQEGVTGLKVPPKDIHSHAVALVSLAKDHVLRQSMGSNAKKWVEKMFSQEKEKSELNLLVNSNDKRS